MIKQLITGAIIGIFFFSGIGISINAQASDLETLQIETKTSDKKHDDKDSVHDLEIDKLKNKDLSKKARIEALELAVQSLQSEIATLQLTPGPQGPIGPQGPVGPQGPAGTFQAQGQVCPEGEVMIGFDLAGNILCSGLILPIPSSPVISSITLGIPDITDVIQKIQPLLDSYYTNNQDCIVDFGVLCTEVYTLPLLDAGFSNLKKVEFTGTTDPGSTIVLYADSACSEPISFYNYAVDYISQNGPSQTLIDFAALTGTDPLGLLSLHNALGLFNITQYTVQPDGSFYGYIYVAPPVSSFYLLASSNQQNSACTMSPFF